MRGLYLFILTFVVSATCLAQDTVNVEDPILKQYLLDNWPSIFAPDGRMVVQTASDSVNDAFDIGGLGISNADPVEYFWRVDQLLLDHNNISVLPTLERYPSVDTIDISYNLLTEFPVIARHTEAVRIVFEHNMIEILSDSVTKKSGFLTTVLGAHNELNTLPKFDHMINLVEVDFTYNRLNFVDILPLANHPNFSSVFNLMPQKPFGTKETITIEEGDNITLQQSMVENDTNDVFTWYKGGVLVNQTSDLNITNAQKENEGEYVLVVTNSHPDMTGISLSSDTITLKIVTPLPPDTTCFTNPNLIFNTNIVDCQTPISLTIDKSTFKDYTYPLVFTLTNISSGQSQSQQTPSFENIGEGSFSLEIEDGKKCKLSYPNFTMVSKRGICDPVISPNGDGVADSWFFNYTGTIEIFNSRGSLIKTLQGPSTWDGTDKNGAIVSPDYYSIISAESQPFHLTVIY